MSVVPIVMLILGAVFVGIGCLSWRSGGKGLVAAGASNVVFAAFLLLPDSASGLRYASLAILGVLVLTTIVTNRRVITWRRPELPLLGATAVALAASYFFTDLPHDLKVALVVLFLGLAMSSIVFMILGVTGSYRSYRASRSR